MVYKKRRRMAITKELIERINELAALKKAGKITDEELKEQAELRKEYLKQFRGNMKQVLDNTDILNEMRVSKFVTNKKELERLDNVDSVMRITDEPTEYVIAYKINEINEKQIMKILKEQ